MMHTASGDWQGCRANALTVDVTGAANGVEVRGGATTIGADSHISSAQGGGLVHEWFRRDDQIFWHGSADEQHLFRRFFWCLGPGRQRLFSTCKIPILQLIVMAVWHWFVGSAAVEITGDSLAITGAAGAGNLCHDQQPGIDLTSDLVIHMSTPDQMAIATQHDDGYAASRINASGRMLINGSVLSKGG
ncbi:hypothetical protein ACNKHX_07410 [Shigella flexneri]